MSEKPSDPYVYPSTGVLINQFGIQDAAALQEIEGVIFALKSTESLPSGHFDYAHLKAIHRHFFGDIYAWAGQQRTVNIIKGDSYFGHAAYIGNELDKLFLKLKNEDYLTKLRPHDFCDRLSFYFNHINAAHPFREGNGRTQRAFCDRLAEHAGYKLDWRSLDPNVYLNASIAGFIQVNDEPMSAAFKQIITEINPQQKVALDHTHFSFELLESIKEYSRHQLKLTELITQKHQHCVNNMSLAKHLAEQAKALSCEVQVLAKKIVSDPLVAHCLKQPHVASLQKQGGFAAIYERMTIQEEMQDILTVLRHANEIADLTQRLNQQQTIERKGRHQ